MDQENYKDEVLQLRNRKRQLQSTNKLIQKDRDIQNAQIRHEKYVEQQRRSYLDKEMEIEQKLSAFQRKKSLELMDHRQRQDSKSKLINDTIGNSNA
jgi:hypothetical protein